MQFTSTDLLCTIQKKGAEYDGNLPNELNEEALIPDGIKLNDPSDEVIVYDMRGVSHDITGVSIAMSGDGGHENDPKLINIKAMNLETG